MPTFVYRPESIIIGKAPEDIGNYEWFGIKDFKWGDVTPWEHIEIPSGLMVHQHIHSPHTIGQITAVDLASLYTALFNTEIDGANHTAIGSPPNVEKRTVGFFMLKAYDQDNNEVDFIFGNFKVERIEVVSIETGKEALFVVHFTADYVTIEFVL